MVFTFKKAQVRPNDEYAHDFAIYDEPEEARRLPRWAVHLLWALAVTLVIVGVTVGCVCGIRGCPARKGDDGPDTAPLRLVVQFDNAALDALELVPAILKPYVQRYLLSQSFLQVLAFDTADVLAKVQPYLQANSSLQFLVRDWTLSPPPSAAALLLEDLAAASLLSVLNEVQANLPTLRRELQQSSSTLLPVNDPLLVNKTQWHHIRIGSQAAWAAAKAAGALNSSIIVAVIDTAFDLQHPDLTSRLWINTAEIPNNGIDDDGNGFVDDYYGFSFDGVCQPDDWGSCARCIDSSDPSARTGDDQHGTHVAGLVGAALNNAQGGSGTAAGVKLMLLKVTDCTGQQTAALIARAMDYAYRMGAHLISLSFADGFADLATRDGSLPQQPATPPGVAYLQAYQDRQTMFTKALKPLSDKGVLTVVAAGNYGLNVDAMLTLGYTNAPCSVQLPNILCVGATEPTDKPAFFSNRGATMVDISAPGSGNIWSTWGVPASGKLAARHTYAGINGTSQATPIVAGVAAAVTAVLGSVDQNYYRAEQVKQVLLATGDSVTSLNGWTATGKRLNSFAAVQSAVTQRQSLSSAAVVLSPAAGLKDNLMAATGVRALVSGFTETYWTYRGTNQLLDTTGQRMLEQRLRPIGSPWASWAAVPTSVGGTNLVSLSGWIQLTNTGLHAVLVQYATATQAASRVFISGRGLTPLSGTPTKFMFYASSPGWYPLSVLLLPASAGTGAVIVQLAVPAAGGLVTTTPVSLNAGAFSVVAATAALPIPEPPYTTNQYSDPRMPYSWGTATGFTVAFNRTTPTILGTMALNAYALALNATANSIWQRQVVVPDLNIQVGQLGPTLLPAGDTSTAVFGLATAYLNTQRMPSSVMFQVSCQLCRLTLDGVLVTELWDSVASTSTATRNSACVSLQTNTADDKSYRLELLWVARAVGSSALSLKWKGCTASTFDYLNSAFPLKRASLSPAVISTNPTASQAPMMMGWVGGVQCDVWLPPSTNGTIVPSTPPLYKVRLPRCPSPELAGSATCTTLWSFSVQSLVPGIPFSFENYYTVRCWAYTNASLPANLAAITGADASGIPTALYFAGQQRYAADVSGVTLKVPVPDNYQYGRTLHQVVAIWAGIFSTTTLMVTGDGKPLTITLSSFMLPIWTIPMPGPVVFSAPNPCGSLNTSSIPCDVMVGTNPLGLPGIFVRGLVPTRSDTAAIVANDLAQVSMAITSVSGAAQGLSTSTGAAVVINLPFNKSVLPTTQAWYASTEGYLTVPSAGLWTLSSNEASGSASLLVAGDVTLRNAPQFSSLLASASGVSVQVWLPAGYVRLRILTKSRPVTSGSQAAVGYNWRMQVAGGRSALPLNITYWRRTK